MASITIEQIGMLFDQKVGVKLNEFSTRIATIENTVAAGMAEFYSGMVEFKNALEAAQVEIAAIKGKMECAETGHTNEPQGQGSAAKRSRSTPTSGSSDGHGGRPAASSASSVSTPSFVQGRRVPKGRAILTTENHAMVKKEDIIALAESIATDANLDSIPKHIVGGKLAKTFSINFDTKDEVLNLQYAKQFVASRFKNGQWAEARVRGPDDAAGAAGIKIFINVDKEAVQRRGDYAWRSLRRSIAAMRENVTGDARERTVAVGYIGVARVRFESSTELFHLSWLPHAEKAFTEAERRKLEREFDAGGPSGTAWG